MLIDFSLFVVAGRAEMMRIGSSAHQVQQRAVVIVAVFQLLLLVFVSAFELPLSRRRVEKTSQASGSYIVLRRLIAASRIPFKGLPRAQASVHKLQCYTLHVRVNG